MKKYALLVILFSLSNSAIACPEGQDSLQALIDSPIHEISGPFSIASLEKKHMIENRETKEFIPFGYVNKQWVELKSKFKKDDNIYFMELKEDGFFMNGHILVRKGCVIDFLMGEIS